tara:strand:+ start:241498 stop:242430 length:933 start_codon:yes stop_codon:yes gene_type:complete
MVETDLKKLEKQFSAKADIKSFERIYKERSENIPNIQIPVALDHNFNRDEFKNESILQHSKSYYENRLMELERKLFSKKKEIHDLEQKLKTKETKTNRKKLETANRVAKKVQQQIERFQKPSQESTQRIFQYTYAPLLTINAKSERIIHPFRYQLRPSFKEEEVPSKINMFNARTDSLEDRPSWRRLFLHRHAALIMKGFYEWVEDPETGKSRQIRFQPGNDQLMWTPCIYDRWESKDKTQTIDSFALLTRDPPPEVEEMGHDRCPVFPKWSHLDDWLNIKTLDQKKAFQIFNDLEDVTYNHQWVSAASS